MPLELIDGKNKRWYVKLRYYESSKSYVIREDWTKFLIHHPNLEKGDVVELYKLNDQSHNHYFIRCKKAEQAIDQSNKQGEPERPSNGDDNLTGDNELAEEDTSVAFNIRDLNNENTSQAGAINFLFQMKLTESDVNRDQARLLILTEDGETHFAFVQRTATKQKILVFRDNKNKEWAMKLTFCESTHTYAISCGWYKFLLDHPFLKEGNVIEFYKPDQPQRDTHYLIQIVHQFGTDEGDVHVDEHNNEGKPEKGDDNKDEACTVTENEQSEKRGGPRYRKSEKGKGTVSGSNNEQGDDQVQVSTGKRENEYVDAEDEKSAKVESNSGNQYVCVKGGKKMLLNVSKNDEGKPKKR